jgi:hypothetical protein
MPIRRALAVTAGLALLATALEAQAPSDDQLLRLGHTFTQWFLTGEVDSIYAHLAPEVQQGVGGVVGVTREVTGFIERAGMEVAMVEEKMTRRQGAPQFWYEATFEKSGTEPLVLRWVFNDKGEVVGAGIGPKSEAPQPD